MNADLYSDRHGRTSPPINTEITEGFWTGVVSLVNSLASKGSFALDFPETCDDGNAIIGVNYHLFSQSIRGIIPNLDWPLSEDNQPDTDVCFDLIELIFEYVAEVRIIGYHQYFTHNHLSLDRENGQENYLIEINRLLKRNGMAYEMNNQGQIELLVPIPMANLLQSVMGLTTGNTVFDDLIADACGRIMDRHFSERKVAVDKLWDAWERLKTIDGLSKPVFLKRFESILGEDCVSILEDTAREWTKVGNTRGIRHKEKGQIEIKHPAMVEFFFFEMLVLIRLVLILRQEILNESEVKDDNKWN